MDSQYIVKFGFLLCINSFSVNHMLHANKTFPMTTLVTLPDIKFQISKFSEAQTTTTSIQYV